MIKFVQGNFARALWIARILLAVFGTLASLYAIESTAVLYSELLSTPIKRSVLIYPLFAVIFAAVMELFARLAAYAASRLFKVYVIPQYELTVWLMLALAVKYVLLSVVNNLNFITPVFEVFGGLLLNFVITAAVFFGLWLILKKVYLNDKNAPYVFRSYALAFAVLTAVSILSGGLV